MKVKTKSNKKTKYIYIVSFTTFGTGVKQDYIDALNTLADATEIKHQLISCGHTEVIIHKALR